MFLLLHPKGWNYTNALGFSNVILHQLLGDIFMHSKYAFKCQLYVKCALKSIFTNEKKKISNVIKVA